MQCRFHYFSRISVLCGRRALSISVRFELDAICPCRNVDVLIVLFWAGLHCSCDVPRCMWCSKEQETLLSHLSSRFVCAVALFRHFGISPLTLFLATFDLCSNSQELLQFKCLKSTARDWIYWVVIILWMEVGGMGFLEGEGGNCFLLRAPFVWGYHFMNLLQQFLVFIHILSDFSIVPS